MIDPKFIQNLKGKDYPTWPGVLDAATKAGLKSLTTRLLQAPSAENNHTAIVLARAEFDDGRVFEDLGDASPANCSAQIATAAIRMASTRAKGRTLRDAINVGQTMFEELPDMNGRTDEYAGPQPSREEARPASNGDGLLECSNAGCKKPLTSGQHQISLRSYGQPLCPTCQKQYTRIG